MISGFDRYFQIAPCFRDEDPRADRLPGEFYQLDVEMSFVEQADVFAAMEPVMTGVFEEFSGGKAVTKGWPRIPYDEAIRKYGSDKPDLRNPIEMQDVTEHFRGSGFKVFAGMIEKDPKARVWAIPAPGGGSPRLLRPHELLGASPRGSRVWDTFSGARVRRAEPAPSPRTWDPSARVAHPEAAGPKVGDAVFFAAGNPEKFYKFAGEARTKIGTELKLVKEDQFAFAWIVDFPMYEWNEEEKKIDFSHNPFSMPQGELAALEAAKSQEELLAIKAYQYDIVCNGFEIASGGIRNHKPATMVKAFGIAGLGPEVVEQRFGGMYRAFQYGAPPHGGMAAGIDRMVMLLVGAKNLREVALFPMNQQANDLLMGAPSEVTPKQLRELHIRVVPTER